MKKVRKWFCTLMSAVMLLCCTACEFPQSSNKNVKAQENPAQTDATVMQEVEQTTSTIAEDSFFDSEVNIEYARPSGETNLAVGAKGDDVRWVQSALNIALDTDIDVDGDFGNTTKIMSRLFRRWLDWIQTVQLGRKQLKSLLQLHLVTKL